MRLEKRRRDWSLECKQSVTWQGLHSVLNVSVKHLWAEDIWNETISFWWLKSTLVNSDCWQAVSLGPTWTIILLMEEGWDGISSWIFPRVTEAVVPGRQWVAVLKKQTWSASGGWRRDSSFLPCLPLRAAVHGSFWLSVERAGALDLAPSWIQWSGGWERSRQVTVDSTQQLWWWQRGLWWPVSQRGVHHPWFGTGWIFSIPTPRFSGSGGDSCHIRMVRWVEDFLV